MANKTKIVHVAIEPDQYRKLVEWAKEARCSISWVIRKAIREYVNIGQKGN